MKIFVLIIFFIFTSSSYCEDKLVAGLFNIVPYAYKENQKIIGITPEIIEKLQEESKIQIDTIFLPYKRMLKYLELGKIDFAIFFLSDYSESFSEKLIPLYHLDTIVLTNKNLKIKKLDDLYNLSLATASGVKYNIKDIEKPLNIHYVKNYKDAILMLKIKRVDAIIGPEKIISYRLSQLNMNLDDFEKPFILTRNTAWIQFSNKSLRQKYKLKLVKAGQKLKEEKQISKIINKYYSINNNINKP